MSDWGRFSLAVAFRKRWGSFEAAGQTYKYADIVAMDWQPAMALMTAAAQYRAEHCACFAYESLSIRANGDFAGLWQHVMAAAAAMPDDMAVALLEQLIDRYVDGESLSDVTFNARGDYLMGKVYSDLAFAAKGSSKSSLQTNKKLALQYLGQARDKCQREQHHDSSVDPYRQAAMAAALAASVAAAYEAAAYLQWKGTRTAALSE